MKPWARLGFLVLFGLLAAMAHAAPTGDHDDEHGGFLDDVHHEPESKEKLRSMYKEQKDRQGEIKANLTTLKSELRDLKNRLRAEKEHGNSAKATELRALIKKKKRDFVAMKEEKKSAQRAKIDLKNQLKSAKKASKNHSEENGGKKDKKKNKKSNRNNNNNDKKDAGGKNKSDKRSGRKNRN